MSAEVAVDADATVTEEAADGMILMALLLLRYGVHLRTLARRRLDDMEVEFIRALAVADLTGPARHRLADELVERARAMALTEYGRIRNDLDSEFGALVRLIVDFVGRQIDTAILPGTASEISEKDVDDIVRDITVEGALLIIWLSRLSGDLAFKLERLLQVAATDQLGATEVIRASREAFESARRNVQPILRTAITAVLAATVTRMVRDHEHVTKGYVHVSILDSRTTKHICLPRAGRRWLVDGTPVGHTMPLRRPPLHMGCRSHLAVWFKSLKELPAHLAMSIREAGRGRAFRDKPVVEPSLEVWLRSRPVAEQRAIVGAKKWEAWKGGKLTVAGLLDQSGRPLTLDQVRKLLGL